MTTTDLQRAALDAVGTRLAELSSEFSELADELEGWPDGLPKSSESSEMRTRS